MSTLSSANFTEGNILVKERTAAAAATTTATTTVVVVLLIQLVTYCQRTLS